MSAAPWKTVAEKPHGFRVTIERRVNGLREEHVFARKVANRATALQAATYKEGFLRVLKCEPLTRKEWDRELSRVGDLSRRLSP